MASSRKTNHSLIISLTIFLVVSTAAARSRGGSRGLSRGTSTAYHHSLDEAEQDYTNWETTNNFNLVQDCSSKYNDTINALTNDLIQFSNNASTPTGAPTNLTSYAEEQVKLAESERIQCVNTYLRTNDSLALITNHFTLSLRFVIFVFFSVLVLF